MMDYLFRKDQKKINTITDSFKRIPKVFNGMTFLNLGVS